MNLTLYAFGCSMIDNMAQVVSLVEHLAPSVPFRDREIHRIRVALLAGLVSPQDREIAEDIFAFETELQIQSPKPERLRLLARTALILGEASGLQNEYDLADEYFAAARAANQRRPDGRSLGRQLSEATIDYAVGRSFGIQGLWTESQRSLESALRLTTVMPRPHEPVANNGHLPVKAPETYGHSMPHRSLTALHVVAQTALAFTHLQSGESTGKNMLEAAQDAWRAQPKHVGGTRDDRKFRVSTIAELSGLSMVQQQVLKAPDAFGPQAMRLIDMLPLAASFDWPDGAEGLPRPANQH